MKCKQLRSGFELSSPWPLPTTLFITSQLPSFSLSLSVSIYIYIYIYIYIWKQWDNYVVMSKHTFILGFIPLYWPVLSTFLICKKRLYIYILSNATSTDMFAWCLSTWSFYMTSWPYIFGLICSHHIVCVCVFFFSLSLSLSSADIVFNIKGRCLWNLTREPLWPAATPAVKHHKLAPERHNTTEEWFSVLKAEILKTYPVRFLEGTRSQPRTCLLASSVGRC